MAIEITREDLFTLFDERKEFFKDSLRERNKDTYIPLRFQLPLTSGKSINLNDAPEYKEFIGVLAAKAAMNGVEAFIDIVTMDSPIPSTLESLRKSNEVLQRRLHDANLYIEELGGTIHPTDWPEYNSEDTLPWSTSPQ